MARIDKLVTATIVQRVFTEPVELAISSSRLAVFTYRNRANFIAPRHHAQCAATAKAEAVLKKYCCAAVIALEGFHIGGEGMGGLRGDSNENFRKRNRSR